jgi:chemotaxis protein CheX
LIFKSLPKRMHVLYPMYFSFFVMNSEENGDSLIMSQTQSKNALDAKLVNILMDSVTEVLTTMAGTNVALQGVQPLPEYKPTGDISSVIGISGDHGEGMLSLSFPEGLARLMVSRLLGLTPDDLVKEDMVDGIGELINMVSGRAKTGLSEDSGFVYRLSLPSIIMGSGHEVVGRTKNAPYLALTFLAEGEEFNLQVTFRTF